MKFILIALAFAFVAEPSLAAQGPGTGPGTAGPLAQWLAFASFIFIPTLAVIFSAWDDSKGFES